LATRFAGSSDLFQNNGRKPWNSINFIDVHDELTLADVYRFNDGDSSWDQGGDHAASSMGRAARAIPTPHRLPKNTTSPRAVFSP
jgi:glycogen operon protein